MVSVFEIKYSINTYTSKFVRNPEKFQFKSGSQYQNHKLQLRVGRGFFKAESRVSFVSDHVVENRPIREFTAANTDFRVTR